MTRAHGYRMLHAGGAKVCQRSYLAVQRDATEVESFLELDAAVLAPRYQTYLSAT
jgi:hypothetical protein